MSLDKAVPADRIVIGVAPRPDYVDLDDDGDGEPDPCMHPAARIAALSIDLPAGRVVGDCAECGEAVPLDSAVAARIRRGDVDGWDVLAIEPPAPTAAEALSALGHSSECRCSPCRFLRNAEKGETS